jgi:hypothetical protein
MGCDAQKFLFLDTSLSNVSNFDVRAALSFNIERAIIKLHGIGGRTVDKLIACDLDKVRSFRPAVVIWVNWY